MTEAELALMPMDWRHLVLMRFGRVGAESDHLRLRLLDRYDGYELYQFTGVFPAGAYFLRYTCPSTGKIYASGVPRQIRRSARRAVAWKFHLQDVTTWELFTEES